MENAIVCLKRTTRPKARAGARRLARLLLLLAAMMTGWLAAGQGARADTISGMVKDPSGALVSGARVEISGGALTQPVVLTTDDSGRFSAANLRPGRYSVQVAKEGFDEIDSTVDLQGSAELALTLTISAQRVSVNVSGKPGAMANSDQVYRQLREVGLGNSYKVENFTLAMDAGTFELKQGTLTLLQPVNRFETGAIFVGQGHFRLKPVIPMDKQEMQRRTGGQETAEEELSDVVFRFSPALFPQFSGTMVNKVDTPKQAEEAFRHWKELTRHRHEVAEGMTQSLLENENIDNVDADLLAALYNPKHPPFFNAYMVGAPHKDLRFFIRTRVGAFPQLDSPEEVGLVNCDGGGLQDGIWYSEHLIAEMKARTASSQEDRRLFATKHYTIETVIAKNGHLFSRATITAAPLIPGERVMKFGLLPSLRVSRVTDEGGQDLHYIQEDRKQDGSFYVILDQAVEVGKEHSVSVEYAGDKVVYDAGGGSFYIGARDSWYPNLNGFGEKALYDLTFRVPKNNVLISVGKLQGQSIENGFAVTHWTTPKPVAVAGFNYGQYSKINLEDSITHYEISGYYLSELPSAFAAFNGRGGAFSAPDPMQANALAAMSPTAMTKHALEQTRAQMQLCTIYFGRAPFDNVQITEQPNFNFGQSWPNLVYLPIMAYMDSTQRWMLFGKIENEATGFVQEVTPHEVAHQWFGHSVGWASYHDQWLSEGFADFAASLFLQQAVGPKWEKDYIEFWERQKRHLMEKNAFGVSPNDSGPLWMGLRLISPKSSQAYQGVTYSKGAFVLSMLRSIMWSDNASDGEHDKAFIEMMHDFMDSHKDTAASTESFKAIAEKHMTKQMNLQQNGRLDWFFDEWVYGTEVPRYDFKYEIQPAGAGGQIKVMTEITQSEVDRNFAMFVPVYADFGKGMVRIGQVGMVGNSTRKAIFDMDRQPKKVAINAYKDILER